MSEMKSYTIPKQTCPACQKVMDMASDFSDHQGQPKAGDICMCFYCATLLIFKEDNSLREVELNDLLQLTPVARDYLGKLQAQLREFNRCDTTQK